MSKLPGVSKKPWPICGGQRQRLGEVYIPSTTFSGVTWLGGLFRRDSPLTALGQRQATTLGEAMHLGWPWKFWTQGEEGA